MAPCQRRRGNINAFNRHTEERLLVKLHQCACPWRDLKPPSLSWAEHRTTKMVQRVIIQLVVSNISMYNNCIIRWWKPLASLIVMRLIQNSSNWAGLGEKAKSCAILRIGRVAHGNANIYSHVNFQYRWIFTFQGLNSFWTSWFTEIATLTAKDGLFDARPPIAWLFASTLANRAYCTSPEPIVFTIAWKIAFWHLMTGAQTLWTK